jgi:hypothetical protein
MRGLRIASGVAVLITSLHFVHGIHHFYSAHHASFWSAVTVAAVVDVFSFIGGCLLLRSS